MEKHSVLNMNGILLVKFKGVALCLILIFCNFLADAKSDHLEPVLGFSEGVMRTLINEKDPRLWMIVVPRREPQYAVILNERVEYGKNYEVTNRQWVLEYAKLKKKIPTRKLSAPEINELVDSSELEQYYLVVTEEFAKRIREAWLDVLKQTRYPDKKVIAWNGTVFVFYYWRDKYGAYYGRTASPKTGQPAMLAELGQKLMDLTQTEEKDREAIQKQCLEIASKIIQKKMNPRAK